MRISPLMMALLALPLVAAVQIDMVYYDAYNEAGSEFVRIINTEPSAIDLEGWTLRTKSSETDAALTGTVAPGGTYIVADEGWDAQKDDSTWPAADHQEILNLFNSDAFVALVDANGTQVSTVGYGNTNVSEGTAHPGAAEGQALVRSGDTGDNSIDFTATIPEFTMASHGTNASETNVTVTVTDSPPEILSWSITDDDPGEGIQILPVPGGERAITVNLTARDNNTLSRTNITVNGQALPASEETTTDFSIQVAITTESTQIEIAAVDDSSETVMIIDLELLPVVGVRVPSVIDLSVAPGATENRTILVENTGTTSINLQIKGVQPTLIDSLLGEIRYALLGQQYLLEEAFRHHDIALTPGGAAAVDLSITSGYVPHGTYTGQMLVAGVAQ